MWIPLTLAWLSPASYSQDQEESLEFPKYVCKQEEWKTQLWTSL